MDKLNDYLKIVNICFIIMVIFIVVVIFLPKPTVYSMNTTPKIDSISITHEEQDMIELTNAYRASHSLTTLHIDSKLMSSAQVKADDLCTGGIWSHDNSKDEPFYKFIQDSGYDYSHTGENLTRGFTTIAGSFEGLINSPRHLENIVGDYKDIGVGYNECRGKNYTVIHYGRY